MPRSENPARVPYLDPSALGGFNVEQIIEKMRRTNKGVRPEDWQRAFPDTPAEQFRVQGDIELVKEDGMDVWKAIPSESE